MKVAIGVIALGVIQTQARRRQLLGTAFLTTFNRASAGRHSPRVDFTLAAHGVGDKVSGEGVRVSRSGLSPDVQWITDPWDRGVLFSVRVDEIVHDVRSKFQHVQASSINSLLSGTE